MVEFKNSRTQPSTEPVRKLSFWRVILALMLVTSILFSGFYGVKAWKNSALPEGSSKPWFASYVDVTATPTYGFEQDNKSQVMLSFIVSKKDDNCVPSWGGVYTIDEAGKRLDLDRRIERLRQQNGDVAVSFGGLINDELALKCTDLKKLTQAYESVIDHYDIKVIDLDIEADELANKDASERRAKTIADIQAKRRAANKPLAVWLTLPVAPQGLTEDGTKAVSYMLKNKVDLAGVNVMTMDYGQSRPKGMSMFDASASALTQTHRQLGILYNQAGLSLNSATLWSKIGATPMIGQNDVKDEVFSTKDASKFNAFSTKAGVGRMSMWSANRDIQCGSNYVNLKTVSDSCSGVKQVKHEFTKLLGKDYAGSLAASAGVVTKNDKQAEANQNKPDDPATSPYRIWKESDSYLEGTKVVWHGNVYQAKWWTQGDMPDNPVLQSWQTPWELIGPVLPGEKPIVQASLPAGTYPEWSGKESYEENSRVLFNGTPYQAKWWTQGDSPAAASSNPTSSPWAPLTQAQINEVLNKKP